FQPRQRIGVLIEGRNAPLRRVVRSVGVGDGLKGKEERLVADVGQHGVLFRREGRFVTRGEAIHARAELIQEVGADGGGSGQAEEVGLAASVVGGLIRKYLAAVSVE